MGGGCIPGKSRAKLPGVGAAGRGFSGLGFSGTWGGGVFCYDGLQWRAITSRDGLLSDRVTGLVAGSRGEVWVWLMDGAINVTMQPFRAFIGDMLPDEQAELAAEDLLYFQPRRGWSCVVSDEVCAPISGKTRCQHEVRAGAGG